jgi:hypothetical protein
MTLCTVSGPADPAVSVVADIEAYWRRGVAATVLLGWHDRNPYAVSATFPGGVVWVFARDLLVEGLCAPAGLGDVHIAPSRDDYGWIEVGLSSPTGCTRFELPGPDVADFLFATTDVIPIGQEPLWLDLDTDIACLLHDSFEGED